MESREVTKATALSLISEEIVLDSSAFASAMDSLARSAMLAEEQVFLFGSSTAQAQAAFNTAKAQLMDLEARKRVLRHPLDPETQGDLFDPFKVEGGCAHPDDYREPLPYAGEVPGDDEWLCGACGYWRKGDAFGVTALPRALPLTDRDLDELLERQAKTSVSRDGWLTDVVLKDPTIIEQVAGTFPIAYPHLPMTNSASSYNSIKALMHELEGRNRQADVILFAPDITVNPSASMITELRLLMQYDERTTQAKAVVDGLYTLETVSHMFVRSREVFFEMHPRTRYSLMREFSSPTAPLFTFQPNFAGPFTLLGRELRERQILNPGQIMMAHL